MKKVYQTKFGGADSPINERGNCFQAAVASILEIPLESSIDIQEWGNTEVWFDYFRKWLKQYGLSALGLAPGGNITIEGYHLIECESATLKNGELHVVVGLNQQIIHDPNPNASTTGKVVDYIVFTLLDPAQRIGK